MCVSIEKPCQWDEFCACFSCVLPRRGATFHFTLPKNQQTWEQMTYNYFCKVKRATHRSLASVQRAGRADQVWKLCWAEPHHLPWASWQVLLFMLCLDLTYLPWLTPPGSYCILPHLLWTWSQLEDINLHCVYSSGNISSFAQMLYYQKSGCKHACISPRAHTHSEKVSCEYLNLT